METRMKILLVVAAAALSACGREPSSLLRQGQLPVNDFPLYVSDSRTGTGDGTVWKYDSSRNRTALATGLSDPMGLATDRFGNLFVVEQGKNRLLKFDTGNGNMTVAADGLQKPSSVTVDSFGEAYVTQDTLHNVIRAADRSVVADYYSLPAAIAAGVNDLLVVGDYNGNRVYWGRNASAPSASFDGPVGVAVDGMGRVYVAEGKATGARVLRYHQTEAGDAPAVVAEDLSAPNGIAVDSVGNVYIVETGKITLAPFNGGKHVWSSVDLTSPQSLAFTQY